MIKKNLAVTALAILLALPLACLPQGSFKLLKAGQELREVFSAISQGPTDSARIALSLDFQVRLRNALEISGSDSYAWDSLKFVAKLESPDGRFRLYNWNVPLTAGGNRYFCLIQFKGDLKKHKPVGLSELPSPPDDASKISCDSAGWYGALYYKIIPFETGAKQTAYILFGWNGISRDISGKLIEVLSFDSNGSPHFGLPVFPDYLDGKNLRIIFRFSSSATMSLRYQVQKVPGKPVWNKSRREYETKDMTRRMIVFDHLMPMDPQLEGQYKFYVPASETAEGFFLEGNSWKYVKEFDAKNPGK